MEQVESTAEVHHKVGYSIVWLNVSNASCTVERAAIFRGHEESAPDLAFTVSKGHKIRRLTAVFTLV